MRSSAVGAGRFSDRTGTGIVAEELSLYLYEVPCCGVIDWDGTIAGGELVAVNAPAGW